MKNSKWLWPVTLMLIGLVMKAAVFVVADMAFKDNDNAGAMLWFWPPTAIPMVGGLLGGIACAISGGVMIALRCLRR